ncbi:hypothetical protein J6590_049157 [Homalodisca vitripennis]|nr:hypothetical protein J6590_049157 [Homalodisca vitripennis]
MPVDSTHSRSIPRILVLGNEVSSSIDFIDELIALRNPALTSRLQAFNVIRINKFSLLSTLRPSKTLDFIA